MYQVIFYYDKTGRSDIVDWLDDLKKSSDKNKSNRINWEKTLAYIGALEKYGTRLGEPFVKHIEEDIWELRPLRNRILFFYWKDNKFVLLHHFVKQTQKTPRREIEAALRKKQDYVEREES